MTLVAASLPRGAEGRWLRRVARENRRELALAMLGGLLRQLGFLSIPLCLRFAIDAGISGRDLSATIIWSAALLGAAAVQFSGLCLWDYFANAADARAGAALRTRLLTRVLGSGAREQRLGDGDLVLRANRDVDLVRVWVHGLATWVVIGLTIVVLVPGIFGLDPMLLVVALAMVPCLVILNLFFPRAFERASGELATAHGRRAETIDHVLRSAVTTRGIGAEAVLRDRHRERSAELSERTVRSGNLLASWTVLGEGIPLIAVSIGIVVGTIAAIDGRLSIGGLVAFSGWMGTVGVAVRVALTRIAQTVEARVAVRRLVEVLGDDEAEEQRQDHPKPGARPLCAESLVTHASVNPVDIALVPGGLTVVTGPTGCGKSTLLRVLAGWELPRSGRVTLGGHPLDTMPAEVIGRSLVLVPQRPIVLARSVRDNLCLGSTVTDERLAAALRSVALLDELDDGLDTMIADGTASLSGGQIQRLALARALVAEPAVLLLDDVTSAVDRETEALIIATLREEAGRRIVIVASHRAPVIAAADSRIAVTNG